MTAPTPMPEHLAEIRRLLGQDDSTSVTQGIALLQSLADPALWALFAKDVELEYRLDIAVGSEIETHVAKSFRADVAFWALRETGRLQEKTQLCLSDCRLLSDLRPLAGLTALESLDLSGCKGLSSLDGLAELPALREVRLDGCDGLTSLAGLSANVRIVRTRTNREDQLRLNGLTMLTEPEATALLAATGTLELNGLETIPDAVLSILARHGGRVSLNGIESLSTAAAAMLAKLHTGDLVLRGLETPTDADEVFAAHVGRVSLGAAFQYIDVGRFDASRDIDTFGARVEATPLVVPVEDESTFTLKHDGKQCVDVRVGVLDDEVVASLFEEGADYSLNWYECDGISRAWGVRAPATRVELPDGTEEEITLRHWPRSRELVRLAQQESEKGDFVQVTTSLEKGEWKSYSLTLSEGVFDLSRVRVLWFGGDVVEGYEYVHEDGRTESFEDDEEASTEDWWGDTDIYFNTGTSLISIDIDDLQGELRHAGVDVEDIDAVRAFLLERDDTEGDEEAAADEDDSPDEDDSDDDGDDDAESSDEDESEDSWKAEEIRRVSKHLEMWAFGTGDPSWLGRVLKGYGLGDTILSPPDLGPHYSRIRSVIQLTDGTVVSSADEGVLRFWDPTSLRCIRSVDTGKRLGPLLALSDGRFLADIDDTCTVWDSGAASPSFTLDHAGRSLRAMCPISDETIATWDDSDTVRIWNAASWTVQTSRAFDDLSEVAVLDSNHLVIETTSYAGNVQACAITIWDARTDRIVSGPFPVPFRRSTAVLPGRGWATTEEGTRIVVRDSEGTVISTFNLSLQEATVSRWDAFDSYVKCGSSATISLSDDSLLVLGVRHPDGALVALRCDIGTGACRELFAEPRDVTKSVNAEDIPLHPDGVLILLPPRGGAKRALIVPADRARPPYTLIMPRGREREGFDTTDETDLYGALLLQDGRLATWGRWHDHAIRLWTPDGVTAGAMGTVSRFWTRDPLERTLWGAPK